MHNGEALFPEALDALMQARARGVQVQFLSNAPRRAASVATLLDRMGMPREAYDGIVSSGEESWQGLKARSLPFYRDLGPVCFHLGAGAKDANMREGLDFRFQDAIDGPEGRADWILNTGPEASTDVAEWIPVLQQALDAGLPMVCANPDRVVMRGTEKELCAGSLAEWYEDQGGVAAVARQALRRCLPGCPRSHGSCSVSRCWPLVIVSPPTSRVPARRGSTCCWSTQASIRPTSMLTCRPGWSGCRGKRGCGRVSPITGFVSEPRIDQYYAKKSIEASVKLFYFLIHYAVRPIIFRTADDFQPGSGPHFDQEQCPWRRRRSP